MEFYTTLLTVDSDKTSDIRRYISAVKKRGFKVLAPDINRSGVDFTIDKDSIIFGIAAVKGVGKAVSGKILKRRTKKGYKSLGHFIMRNLDCLNKKILEQYAKAGLFSTLNINKESSLESVRNILDFMDRQKSVSEYETIFDLVKDIDLEKYIDNCKIIKNDIEDSLSYEIETLGFYITKHPLEGKQIDTSKVMGGVKVCTLPEVSTYFDGQGFIAIGAISSIDVRKTKAKTNMATFELTTDEDSIRCIVFPQSYSKHMDMIEEGKVVAISGVVKDDDDDKTFIVNEISSNYERFILETKVKADEFIDWFNTNDDALIKATLKINNKLPVGIVISDYLSYILEK